MKRPATKIILAAAVIGAAMIGVKGVRVAMRQSEPEAACGPGFSRVGARCVGCPSPLMSTGISCDAPDDLVEIPETTVTIGPSDWEAEGRVKPRVVKAGPFKIDRFEATVGRAFCPACPLSDAKRFDRTDTARAASGITLEEARAYCTKRGARLPTDDEWIVAAAGDKPRRYPWGDTGAVCRRAAFGMVNGPCATGATGPDTVGAHPDGATPLGVEDMAGNVEEWVEGSPPAVRGGSFETALATELRTWPRREIAPTSRLASVGVRCVR